MKRTLSLIGTLALAAGLVQAASVESVNTVGYQSMPIVGGNFNMIAVNWDEIGGTEIHVQDLFDDVSGLTADATAGQSDNLLIWNPVTSGYTTYFLYDSGGAYPVWDGQWVNLAGTVIIDETFPKGATFWLRTRGVSTNLTVAGQVPVAGAVTNTLIAGNFNMIGAAYSADMPINSGFDWITAGAVASTAAAAADNILVWDAQTSNYTTYFLYDSGSAYPVWDGQWVNLAGTEIVTDSLPLGKAAWYRSRGAVDIDWVQNRPY